MALGIPTDKRDQMMLLIIIISLAAGYLFWDNVHTPNSERITANRAEIDSLNLIVDQAKQLVASGSTEELDRRVERFRATLVLMRRLVPEKNEVATLIDDISNRAKVRGVTIGRIQPLAVEPGAPFDTYRYRLEVYGRYDQVGEFLTDVASLPRIVVPQEVALRAAQQQAARLIGDTTGALLEATFSLRTFVKSPAPAPAGGASARN